MAFDGTLKFDTALDQTGFKLGLDNIGGIARAGMQAVTSAVSMAAEEVASLGAKAIEAGKGFESGMAKVIATMGLTKDTVENGVNSYELLKEAAAKAGESTTFSASEAAEALNYLALAGYNATQAADALPAVLDLAAAGGLSLAYASDLATDAMSALGIAATTENLTHFGDQLAKTASKANTSVGQLGEAILTVGGTAKELAGGTTELNAALGVLANAGIKGSEGGTALRNIMLAMTPTTEKAAKAFERLGLESYDADGNLRPLNETFRDLNKALSGMTSQEKTNVLNDIFNKVDLKSATALMSACASSTEELGNAFLYAGIPAKGLTGFLENFENGTYNAMSETEFMTSVMNDFGISSEAAGAVYSAFVTQVNGLSFEKLYNELTDCDGAMAQMAETMNDTLEGDLKSLGSKAEALGIAVYEGINTPLRELVQLGGGYIAQLTEAFKAGGFEGLAEAFGDVLSQSANTLTKAVPGISKAGGQVFNALVKGFVKNIPDLAVTGLTMLDTLVSGFDISDMIRIGEQLLAEITDKIQKKSLRFHRLGKHILKSVTGSVSQNLPLLSEAMVKLIDFAVGLLTDSENLTGFAEAAVSILSALAEGVVQSVPVFADKAPEIMQKIAEALKNAPFSVMTVADSVITAIADSLGLGDKWNKVKEKVSDAFSHFDFETVKLNLELAFEDIPDDVKQNFENVSQTFSEAAERLRISFNKLKDSCKILKEKFQPLLDTLKQYFTSGKAGENAGDALGTSITFVAGTIAVATDSVSRLLSGVMDFGAWLAEGSTGAEAFSATVIGLIAAVGSFAGILKIMETAPVVIAGVQAAIAGVSASASGLWAVIAANPLAALIALLAGAVAALVYVSQTSEEWQLGWEMIKDTFEDFADAWKTGFKEIKQKWEDFWDSWKVGEQALETFGKNVYDFIDGARQWGVDLVENFISGVKEKWNEWVTTWENFGGVIYDLLHHSHPDKGLLKDDYTWMPDMMQSFSEGIRQNIPLVANQAEALTDTLKSTINMPDISSGALEALRLQSISMNTSMAVPSATSEVVNNHYSYSTVNQNTTETRSEAPALSPTFYVQIGNEALRDFVVTVIDQENAVTGGNAF